MPRSNSADSVESQLVRTVERLGQLEVHCDLLKADAYLAVEKRDSIALCVDFCDLRRYLSFRPGSTGEMGFRGRLWDYVRVLLFNRPPYPLVLLPCYYQELRRHIARMLGLGGSGSSRIHEWADAVRVPLQREVDADDGLFQYLKAVSERVEPMNLDKLDQLATRLLGALAQLGATMGSAVEAGGMAKRFERLWRSRNIRGVRDVLPESREVVDGAIRRRAAQILAEKRPDPEFSESNETDALAIATLCALNSAAAGGGVVFRFVTSAPSMIWSIERLNRERDAARPLELRELDYWALWYALAIQSRDKRAPTFAEASKLSQEIGSVVGSLRTRCVELSRRLRENPANSELAREVVECTARLHSITDRVSRPVLGVTSHLAFIQDFISPIAAESDEFQAAVKRIGRVLDDLRRGVNHIAELKQELRALLALVDQIIERAGAQVVRVSSLVSQHEAEACLGVIADVEPWEEPYGGLLRAVEEGGPLRAQEIFATVSAMPDDPDGRRGILLARVFLLRDDLANAEEELARLPDSASKGYHAVMTRVSLELARGRLDLAERLATGLVGSYDNAAVRSQLAKIAYARYLTSGGSDDYAAAKREVDLSRDRLENASPATRAEVALVYYDILLAAGGEPLSADAQRTALGELGGLAKRGESGEFGPRTLARVYELMGRITAAATEG